MMSSGCERPHPKWVREEMESRGFVLKQLQNNRLFYVHPNGMKVRRKNAEAFLNSQKE